ncbi:MAG TPA: hypothetical protein VKU19_34435 [Bryobacteraceae bacterium]|nr:hypothetical protein [Bryobacteraceae bacterium]
MDLILPGGDLFGTSRQFATWQRFQHHRRNQAVAEQGDFLSLRMRMTSTAKA